MAHNPKLDAIWRTATDKAATNGEMEAAIGAAARAIRKEEIDLRDYEFVPLGSTGRRGGGDKRLRDQLRQQTERADKLAHENAILKSVVEKQQADLEQARKAANDSAEAKQLKERLDRLLAALEVGEDTTDWPDKIAQVLAKNDMRDEWPTLDLLEAIGVEGAAADRNATTRLKTIMEGLGWKKCLVWPLSGEGSRINGYRKPRY